MLTHRGRRSADELELMNSGRHAGVEKRCDPPPPRSLEPAEAREWREMVASMPADYFANYSMQTLLELLCWEIGNANYTSKLIDDCRKKNKPNREYLQLVNMQLKGSDMIMQLSKALGFLRPSMFNQSRQ